MSELRWHPLLRQWVITATHRQERTFLPPADYCPLCPTRPGGFPTEVPAASYDIVVFENKFPSLRAAPPAPAVSATALSPVRPAEGICEVVLYSPNHGDTLGDMPLDRVANLAWVWRERYLELARRPSVKYVLVFENRGEAVGVTLHHPHGQIYAFTYLPPVIEQELLAARAHRLETGRCLFCDLLAQERMDGRRVVLEGDRFVAFVPFHARWPYEVYLAPKAHQASMAEWTRDDVEDLAALLKGLVLKFDALFGKPFSYMMVVHQAPTGGGDEAAGAHLHFEFYSPHRSADRLKYLAGCESGAGTFINDTLPEESAERLRRAGPASVAALREAEAGARAPMPGVTDPGTPRPAEALARALGDAAVVEVVAPGRVNLIGEHTDYNEGLVLPMAIEAAIHLAARPRPDDQVRIHAMDLGETVAFRLSEAIPHDRAHAWSDYLRGVLWALSEAGMALRGMDIAFGGTVPQGAGLSSSAALEVATALAAQAVSGFAMDVPGLARLCQRAENDFVGMQCGIMDQFASLAARAGHALLLDCRSLAFEHVPLELGDHAIAIVHSGVKHALVGSEYNVRRRQCLAGVAVLRAQDPAVQALRDVSMEALEAARPALDPVVYRRCRHVVTEDARVSASIAALRAGDLARFGAHMDASHASLRDDYEVSCPEVDLLVELARRTPGVLGARITGGGFGGCTVNLVERRALEALSAEVLPAYQRRTGRTPRLWVSSAAGGARVR